MKRLYEEERRKTSSNQKTLSQIHAENKNLNMKLKEMQHEIEEYKSTIDDLEQKIKKATSIISTLEYAH